MCSHFQNWPASATKHGSMSTDDMQASNTRLKTLQTSEEVAAYGEGVRQHLIAFLQSNDTAAFDRVVPAHYGGEVTVLELLTIILSHSYTSFEAGVLVYRPRTRHLPRQSCHRRRFGGHCHSSGALLRGQDVKGSFLVYPV